MDLAAENNSFGDDVDEGRIKEHILRGTRRDGGLHGVIDGDAELAGSIGVIWDRWWYSKRFMFSQLWFFVRPKYRSRGYERDLINWAKWHRAEMEKAVEHPVPLVHTVISQKRLPAKLRLWRRHSDAEMAGGIFIIR
jgi:GNAT superfamily N-acetyltransferase